MNEFKPGLEGIVAVETEIAEPDREGGSLRYRGVDIEELVGKWRAARERGFDTVVQELVPDSDDQIWSLFAYIGRNGRPLASATGRSDVARPGSVPTHTA